VAGTHDRLASHRMLWRAWNDAMQNEKIKPNQIDGGFAFNGWYFGNSLKICNPEYKKNLGHIVEPPDFTCLYENKNWQYQISYTPEAGFSIEKRYHFRRWWPWRNQTLYLLRRQS
jgi:hypothetical protein